MNTKILIGVLMLFIISIIVRIIPSLLKNKINIKLIENIEKNLPTSIFIAMSSYLFITELNKNPIPATISIGLIFFAIYMKIKNIILIVMSSTLLYVIIDQFF